MADDQDYGRGECPQGLQDFDFDMALERLGGEAALFREMVECFFADSPRILAEIRAAVQCGDAKRLERNAHSLKGTMLYLGAESACRAANHVENIGRSAELKDAAEAVSFLEAEVQRLGEAIRGFRLPG